MERLQGYRHIWVFDFEYVADDGEVPEPVCFVAVDLVSGRGVRLWRREMRDGFDLDTGDRSLFVCFSGVGDMACFLDLGWPLPARLVDLYPEIRQQFYDRADFVRSSLLNAARLLGFETMESQDKEAARDLIITRGFTDKDRGYLLDYCEEDVDLTADVFRQMYSTITCSVDQWNGVLLRGRYTMAMARIERNGIPIDFDRFSLARHHWGEIRQGIVDHSDTGGVYEGTTFRMFAFEALVKKLNIPWPRLDSGELDLKDKVFRDKAKSHGGVIANIREVRYTLSQMRLSSYTIGCDKRNRVWFNPYGSVTGRNQPSNSKFIFGSARWTREFIRPPEGHGLAYVDWSHQEIGIAAGLSGDRALWKDYCSGDVYLAFGKRVGMIPEDGTKKTHKKERHTCKGVVLGLGYGLTEHGLAANLRTTRDYARHLIQLHQEAYHVFHEWSLQVASQGSMGIPIRTRFGWERRLKSGANVNFRSLKNWPMQANGAEMMRLAACEITEAGIRVCCPVHDAFLIEAPLDELDQAIAKTQEIMADVSEIICGEGYRLNTDADVFRYPNCYRDEDGGDLYQIVMSLAEEAGRSVTDPLHDAANL